MLLQRDASTHYGKKVVRINHDTGEATNGLIMVDEVIIEFDDGSVMRLGLDWYGYDCYISEKTPKKSPD